MQALIKRSAFLVSRVNFQAPQVVRAMGSGPLDEKEKAQEKMYFDKEERKIMEKLLNKLNKQSELDRHHVESSRADSNSQLKKIFSKYRIEAPNALLEDLNEWKRDD